MMLREYLEKNHLTTADFSKIIGYAPQYICNAMCGHQRPGRKLRMKICEMTIGKVGVDDWPTEKKTFLYDILYDEEGVEK